MSSVLAKVALSSCETFKSGDGNGGTGARVIFSAVKDESWGKYTPQASFDMYINNPAAAKVFVDAWRKYTESDEKDFVYPTFYVRFTLASEAEAGKAEA